MTPFDDGSSSHGGHGPLEIRLAAHRHPQQPERHFVVAQAAMRERHKAQLMLDGDIGLVPDSAPAPTVRKETSQ